MIKKRRVAILISGRGSNMASLIEAAREETCPYEVALVISNRPDALGLDRASAAGVATLIIDHTRFGKDRPAFEHALGAELVARNIDIVCLAGFMRLFTPAFVNAWSGRMLNIHPSLLPAFPGLDPHGQALRAGVRLSGTTVHFVTPETDAGPIVAQAAVPVLDGDTIESLTARVLAAEHRLYPAALALLANARVRMVDERATVDADASAQSILFSLDMEHQAAREEAR